MQGTLIYHPPTVIILRCDYPKFAIYHYHHHLEQRRNTINYTVWIPDSVTHVLPMCLLRATDGRDDCPDNRSQAPGTPSPSLFLRGETTTNALKHFQDPPDRCRRYGFIFKGVRWTATIATESPATDAVTCRIR